ncbi:type III-B CRISPR module RAMP protein Cmr4 [Methylovulum psychrotolerans]|uniref:Type III-B CRISPR module RAMP protein Cmr4 n=2 Tax=Methylovulum psychrotolerans TaxID=1704499 RepID=A0A1Z4C5C2_9GAMM|nr:type III-B CRISPR module RAMP protein Cmr4 [Methylovulum psychrotolerans]
MATTTALLGLWAQTSIHAGAGSSIDGIDLPIQRESHNGWPCVFGSSVKGALRAKAEDLWGKNDGVRYLFGPDSDSDKASEHAGAIMVSDARLLLLPVRSLTGHFKWVTCPALLKRLQNDAKCFDVAINAFIVPSVCVSALESGLQPQAEGDLFLEEYRLTTQKCGELNGIVNLLSGLSGIEEADLRAQLVLVSDAMFTYLCQYATPVAAHIAIDNTTKTVKKGALWYEETLPPETVFYLALKASAVRDPSVRDDKGEDVKGKFENQAVKDSKAEAVLASITDVLLAKPYLQIGGNETVGMGWCKVQISKGA